MSQNQVLPTVIRYSPLAIRFLFGSAGASPSHFVPVPRPTPLVPLKFGAQFLRHQLRVKTRSMKFRFLPHQLRAKAYSIGGGILHTPEPNKSCKDQPYRGCVRGTERPRNTISKN